ncbi:MAG: hypothetical protein KatS3mg081_2374 [Gemmatimonadales bacterium]|nr:hypothetical protein HRbin33_00871 [bacterium HR33]GIW53019.1 MAG: hypothetical protein KatS3mg081_2374 [Gemmatimonadales bacterium]
MTAPALSRTTLTFTDRAEALGHFFSRAGEAPRLLAYDEEMGCPLSTSLAALEWTHAVGILFDGDLIHAARLGGETAAVVVERKEEGRRLFVYIGPRMDAPPADPYEGTLLYDEPGVRAYLFAQRAQALAHFLRATQGVGAVVSLLSRRAPEVRHVRRWLEGLLKDPAPLRSSALLAGWFATSGAGFLFLPRGAGDPLVYEEVGIVG